MTRKPHLKPPARTEVVGSKFRLNSTLPAVLLAVLVTAGFVAGRAGFLFLYHPLGTLDGAMQTWFALDAFSQGRQLGHDFQSYLGTTMLLFLVPFYLIFGGTLFASSVAASTAVAIGYIATFYGLLRLTGLFRSATLWALVAVGVAYMSYTTGLSAGNSLRPLRWALPYLMLPFILTGWHLMHAGRAAPAGLILGLVGGAGMLWSNDSGIPAFAALFIATIFCSRGDCRDTSQTLSVYLAVSIATFMGILVLVSHGAPGAWLAYNFGAIPQDQTWYFGPWGSETRIVRPQNVLLIFSAMDGRTRLAVMLLVISLLMAAATKIRGHGEANRAAGLIFLGLSALGTSLIPQLGGHVSQGYNGALVLVGLLSPLVAFNRQITAIGRWHPVTWRVWRPGFIGLCILLIATLSIQTYKRSANIVARYADGVYVPELGFLVPPDYAAEVAAVRSLRAALETAGVAPNRRLQSTYPSALGIVLGAEAPTPYGAIIHALGYAARDRFAEVVAAQEVAFATSVRGPRPGWPDWNIRSGWYYFRPLHLNYVPVALERYHILWERRDTPLSEPSGDVGCTTTPLLNGGIAFEVTAPFDGFVEVSIALSALPHMGRGRILTAMEDSPFTRVADFSAWEDAPSYGLPPRYNHLLFLPVVRNEVSRITLSVLGDAPLENGTCTAAHVLWPNLTDLPDLGQFVERMEDSFLRGALP